MTPIRPLFDTRAATPAPGSTTPRTGMFSSARSAGRATAEAVLQATTRRSMSQRESTRALRSAYWVTVEGDLVP